MARKVPKRDYGQAKSAPARPAASNWTPFAAPKGQKDVADDVEYEAVDRVKRTWFTNKPKRG
jgi:hypothetical protein